MKPCTNLNTKELVNLSRLVLLWRYRDGMNHFQVMRRLGKRYGWSPADCEELFMRMDGIEGRGA